jgi:uncharacterized protein
VTRVRPYHPGVPNRLAGETSPYLLQHANNPVDWYPWGPEALARAKELDRPIFLSIGYAACHWCHVMERESFEHESTAQAMNGRFVSIKVDREERPDLDQLYMGAVQAMTGQGGWPMSVFLTPDGKPFYGGTYYPDEPRHGMPSFRQVLDGIDRAWREQRDDLEASGTRLVETLIARQGGDAATDDPTPELIEQATAALGSSFDTRNGSWGSAPKFPPPMTIEFLLRRLAGGDPRVEAMARFTLDKMADGGIHDQLGGGFHRYSTDSVWLVPHFEQMLYDNAQLARVYVHAWAATGETRYADVARGTLDYMIRELTTPDGAFAASQDADTDGIEGLTFVWSAAEIREVLGADAEPFMAAYGVTDEGNWEGRSILTRVWPEVRTLPPSREDPVFEAGVAASRALLLRRRQTRSQPARDDKALAAWNGLAIGALADAGRLLGEERFTAAAIRAATAITAGLLSADGSLGRSWKDGRATGQGVLEDHADLADGLLALYEATHDERWFVTARGLMDRVLEHFADPAGGFFDTADDHEALVVRPKDVQDNAVPSGNAMAAFVLVRLAAWTGEGRYRDAAEGALRTVKDYVARFPTGFALWLSAMDLALADVVEVAIVGDPADPATQALLGETTRAYRPNQVVSVSADPATSVVPLMADRTAIDGRSTAYVCRGFVCRLPVTSPEALRTQLEGAAAPD